MRILLVTPFLPYPGVPHAGGKLVFHLLSTLTQNHSVCLVSRIFPGEEAHLSALRKIVPRIETVSAEGPIKMRSSISLLRTFLSYRRLARKAKEILEREPFDICQVEFTETAILFRAPKGVPSILSLHDVIAKPAYRRYENSRGGKWGFHWMKWKTLRALERRAISGYGMVFVLSEVDREWACRLYPGCSFRVLRYPAGLEFRNLPRAEIPGRILFVGALNRPQNVESVRYILSHVWPVVREKIPDAEFWVAGGGLGDDLRMDLSGDPRIRVPGWVDNLEEHYKSAAAFVAPVLVGGGIIVKILDALAAGVPVVTTTYGNEGIGAKEGEEILVSDTPSAFTKSVLDLLGDPGLRGKIGERGKRFADAGFSMKGFEDAIGQSYREVRN